MRLRGFPAGNKSVSKTRKGGGVRPFIVGLAEAILKGRQPHRRSGNDLPLRRRLLRRPDHRLRCRRLPIWRSDPAQRSDFASQIKAGLTRGSALSPRRPTNRRIVFFQAAAGRICKHIKKCCAIQQYLTPFGTGGCGCQRDDMRCGAALKENTDLLRKHSMSCRCFIQQAIEVLLEARLFKQALAPMRHYDLEGEGRVSLLYEPSGHLGGDLVGLFPILKRRYGLYAVEFAGHGVASALMTARITGFLNSASPDPKLCIGERRTGQSNGASTRSNVRGAKRPTSRRYWDR